MKIKRLSIYKPILPLYNNIGNSNIVAYIDNVDAIPLHRKINRKVIRGSLFNNPKKSDKIYLIY